jgi:hypothetical protein
MTLNWQVGSNGNLFADGPRPNGPETHVRYCIAPPHPVYGNGLFDLMWNGHSIGGFVSVDAAKVAAELEAE